MRTILVNIIIVLLTPAKAFGWTTLTGAKQTVYQSGVPHTNKNGGLRTSYSSTYSFLPIWMYGQKSPTTAYLCHPDEATKKWDENDPTNVNRYSNARLLKDANFTAGQHWGYPWEFAKTYLDEAARQDIQVLEYWQPLDDHTDLGDYTWENWGSYSDLEDYLTDTATHPNVLGYVMTEETGRYFALTQLTFEQWIYHFTDVKAAIANITARPVFILDNLWVTNQTEVTLLTDPTGGLDAWLYMHSAGKVNDDIHALDVYEPNLDSITTFDHSRSLTRAAKFITDTYSSDKPYWAMINVFEDGGSYVFPTNTQLRAMVYMSIIHGATGIGYFGSDDYAMRLAGLVGVRPDTPEAYLKTSGGNNTFCGDAFPYDTLVSISSGKAIQANSLYAKMSDVNSELLSLKEPILSPTSTLNYTVEINDTPVSDNPIRTMLKEDASYYYLLAVNLDNVEIDTRITLPGVTGVSGSVLFESRSVMTNCSDRFTDVFAPFDVHVYKFAK